MIIPDDRSTVRQYRSGSSADPRRRPTSSKKRSLIAMAQAFMSMMMIFPGRKFWDLQIYPGSCRRRRQIDSE